MLPVENGNYVSTLNNSKTHSKAILDTDSSIKLRLNHSKPWKTESSSSILTHFHGGTTSIPFQLFSSRT